MAVHTIKSVQRIPVSPEKAWTFYSDPVNLQRITPEGMNFHILSRHHGQGIYPGQVFEYKVSPLWRIPLYWMTEITHVNAPFYFVDEQRRGPYRFWQHQHHFRAIEGGVEMTDIIHYRIPLGFLGRIANRLWVRNKLREIFTYRFHKVGEIFGSWPGQSPEIIID